MNLPNIYIGKIIAKIMSDKKITKAELARKLNVRPQSVDYMLGRKSIDTDTMYKVSQALNYDFSQLYALKNNHINYDINSKMRKNVKARLIVEVELDDEDLQKLDICDKLHGALDDE